MFDSERISSGAWIPPWSVYQHYARYAFAVPYVQGRDVLDAACGTGYGVKYLCERGARSVKGIDASDAAIREARSLHQIARAEYAVGDVCQLPIASQSVDVYLSFETIEHLPDTAGYLAEAARVLRPGGVFICTTPNRPVSNPGTTILHRPYNPFHVREYSEAELLLELKQIFPSISFFGQRPFASAYVELLGEIGMLAPILAVRVHQACKLGYSPFDSQARHAPKPMPFNGVPEVLVAVCSTG